MGLPALAQEITAARYAEPTTRYAHGVLGDAVEWGALVLELSDGTRHRITLPQALVFEDIAPRLADLDHDGTPEVIVVETSLDKGARMSIYGPKGRITATPHIGRSHRWLAPIGAADLDGDGRTEIAYIDRPHLAKTLRIWRYEDGTLRPVADHAGLSNHKIGWDFIAGGIRTCGNTPELITANADWSRVMATTFQGGRVKSHEIGAYTSPQSLTAALTCP
ncbi:FG-GAP repeat protein [Roseovarius gaetbuli]|uniref:FG-GAP repeat protein n=2 Tax=Roseovarius gaetbuli TaxID=1356575 RepID=A0A1X6ZBZ1_9RHOB|nr:FG-GAP repeat protein [Roseovarius gaetbuli]